MHAGVRRGKIVLAGLALLTLAGCNPVNIEKTKELDPFRPWILEIDPPRSDQKISVTITAPEKVSAYLYVKENQDAVENAILAKKVTAQLVLDHKIDERDIQLEAIVPAKKPFSLRVSCNKKTEVQVKIVGR